MAFITFTDPIIGQDNALADPAVLNALDTIRSSINGNIGGSNLLPAFLQQIMQINLPAPSGKVWGIDCQAPGGTNVLTFSASAVSAVTTLAHNLAAPPACILTSNFYTGSPPANNITIYGATNGSTDLDFIAFADASLSTSIFFYWFALSYLPAPTS